MSEPTKETEAKAPKAGGKGGLVLSIVLPALFAAGAGFGGARLGAAQTKITTVHQVEHVPPKPPGPTLSLDPFVFTVADAAKKPHVLRVTLAVEFDAHVKEEAIKPLVPRVRDAMLTELRKLTLEEATDGAHGERLRGELLEKLRAAGAVGAERVLLTDLVTQ